MKMKKYSELRLFFLFCFLLQDVSDMIKKKSNLWTTFQKLSILRRYRNQNLT